MTRLLAVPPSPDCPEEIVSVAHSLLVEHGDQAEIRALERAGISNSNGSDETAQVWRQVYRAIGMLRAGALKYTGP